MSSQCWHYSEQWTLRDLLWAYEGSLYHQWIGHAATAAATYNAQRTKASQKVWLWVDLHPWHATRVVRRSGRETIAALAASIGAEVQWAEGFNPGVIGGQLKSD